MNRRSVLVGRALALAVLFFVTVFSLCGHIASPALVGVHSWAGGLLLMGSAVHLVSKPGWLKMLFSRPAPSLPAHVRSKRVVDRWLSIAGSLCALSGALTVAYPHGHAHVLHGLTGVCMIGLLSAHLLMHRRWLSDAVRRLGARGPGGERIPAQGSRP